MNNTKKLKNKKQINNFRILHRINTDGSVREIIQLSAATKKDREEIIFAHFISFRNRFLGSKFKNSDVVERDNPWDFTLQKGNEKINIEITSIAENKWKFEKMKREEVMSEVNKLTQIRLRELRKYDKWFDHKTDVKYKGQSGDLFVKNPYYSKTPVIYTGASGKENRTLKDLILEAINKKNSKEHLDKNNTVIIIDNRCIVFTQDDLVREINEIVSEISELPFAEIYFYIGYHSDNDGSNAAYSFYSLKLPKKLEDYVIKNHPDKYMYFEKQ